MKSELRMEREFSELTKSPMDERWQSVEEIAGYLGVSKDTVYTWLSTKRMPAHRVGRLWKFKRAEIDDWVKSGGASEPRDEAGEKRRKD